MQYAILVLFISLLAVGRGEVFYKSGFEAANEPFGNYARGRDAGMTFSDRAGGPTSKSVHSGDQAITPGPGNGSYGETVSRIFSPPLAGDSIWLEYRLRSDDAQPEGYKAFLYLFGNTEGKAENTSTLVRLSFCAGKITADKNAVFPFELGTNWHHVKLHLKYKTQNYDLQVDDQKFPDIPFCAGKLKYDIRGLGKVVLGGGAATDKLTFYDDLYIGSESAGVPTLRACPSSAREVGTMADREPSTVPAGSSPAPAKSPDQNDVPYAALNLAASPPNIDGKLDDACWLNASCLAPFVGTAGDYGSQQQTQVFITYDRNNVYIGFKCFDIYLNPMLNQLHMVQAKCQDRDSGGIFRDDSVEIFLAPFPDQPERFYQIAVNCAGAIYDTALPDPGLPWNAALEVGTGRNEEYWTLEIKVPLADLQTPNVNTGATWRVNFCRNKRALGETSVWSPTFGSFHNFQRFGILRFADGAPVVRALALPAELAEGTNALEYQLATARDANLLLKSRIAYENADAVESAVEAKVPAGKTIKTEAGLLIDSNVSARRSSRRCALVCRVTDGITGEQYYATPELKFPLLKYTPFRTSFIAQTSGIYFFYFNDLYIANNSALIRNLLIQHADDVAAKFTNCEFVVEMPDCLTLMAPSFRSRASVKNDLAYVKEVVASNGKKRKRYTVTVPRGQTYSIKKMGQNNRYTNSIDLIFLCAPDQPAPFDETLVYYTRAQVDGKTVAEPPVALPLRILPAIRGKRPEKYPIVSSFDGYNAALPGLSPEKKEKCLGNIIQAGFNVFSALDSANYPREFLNEVRAKGLKIEMGYFPNQANYFNALYPDPREYLRKNPQHRAVRGNGKVLDNEVSVSHLLNDPEDGEYRAMFKKRVAEVANNCDLIIWDHEVAPLGPRAVSFSAADLKDFRESAGIKDEVTIDEVQTRYKDQWNDFQYRRFAQRARLIQRLIKEANSNCLFGVYSGYQHTPPSYGTDWKLMAAAIDYAECGYGRPLGALEDTLKAIAPKKLIASELIAVAAGDVGYNFDNLRLNLFRRVTDANGGLMIFYSTLVDGRFWTAVGDISRLVSEHEAFFLNHVRDDALLEIKAGFSREDLAVLRNDRGERLIFLFNNSATDKTFEFRNLSPFPKARLRDYYENRDMSDSENVGAQVKSLDVKVLVYLEERGK